MTTKCNKHPKYKALMQPHVLCKECWVFFYHNTERAYAEALKQIQKSCQHANVLECDYPQRLQHVASKTRL